MEIQAIVDALRATTSADNQGPASDYLKEMSKMIGFSSILLKLVMNESLECAVRQAAVIYLKNLINQRWSVEDESKELPLSEQDKAPLKQNIIAAIVHSPDAIRVQLCSCIQCMMRCDFPFKWPKLIDEIVQLLHSSNGVELHGALFVVHRLSKIYEYKPEKDRLPLVKAMTLVLPLLHQRVVTLLEDNSPESCLLQKLILKIFFCLTEFSLNLTMVPIDQFAKWLHVCTVVVQRDVPADANNDVLEDTVYWKCKKWAIKIITRVFERYGCKGQVEETYAEFADHYCKEFAVPVAQVVLKSILEPYVHKQFVSTRVLHLAITHLSDAVSHAKIWLTVKPHLKELLQTVIFPLLTHSADDEQLWEEDPEEYLRYRFDVFEDLHSPSAAAGQLLQAMSRRMGVLMPTIEMALGMLGAESSPHNIDAALHVLAVLAPSLNKNKKSKREVQILIDHHVTPRISHLVRFVRVRACYAVKSNSNASFTNTLILGRVVRALIDRLRDADEELPVKVEAATAIAALLTDQEVKVLPMVKPFTREILMDVLRLIARTHIDDLPNVVEKIIENFEEDVIPVAYEVICELVNIFEQMTGLNSDDTEAPSMPDDATMTVMGVLQTMESVLALIEDHEEIVKRVEPVVRGCIVSIFENFCSNYFDEALSLTQTMISVKIGTQMWPIYDMVYRAFDAEGAAFFCDVMPVLHCYLTVDTTTFLSDASRPQRLLEMCEKTLADKECGDDSSTHAAKLIEVFILQCMGQIDNYLPAILQLAYGRYMNNSDEDGEEFELQVQLLVIFIAAFYYNADLCIQSIAHLKPAPPNGLEWLTQEVLKMESHFDGVHNRKMLLYFISKLLTLPVEHLPQAIRNAPKALTELCISQFSGLQKCIKAAAECNASDTDSSDDSSDEDRMNEELNDSDDDVDESTLEYLEAMKRRKRLAAGKSLANGVAADGDTPLQNGTEMTDEILPTDDDDTDTDDDYDDYDVGDVELDEFETPLDVEEGGLNVFTLFKESFQGVQQTNPLFFQALVDGLDDANRTELQKLMTVCTQQENVEHSKRVAQSGGYIFDTNAAVPTSFKFT